MNPGSTSLPLLNNPVLVRVSLLAALLLVELLLLTIRFDTGYIPDTYKLFVLMGHTGKLLKIAVTIAGALLILCFYRKEKLLELVRLHSSQPHLKPMLLAHAMCFAAFAVLTWIIFKYAPQRFFIINFAIMAWFACAGLTFISLLLCALPYKFWRDFFTQERHTLIVASAAGALAWLLGQELVTYASLLNEWTFQACYRLLSLFFEQPFVDVPQKILGVSPFIVEIKADCSGYEGIGLIIGFLSMYLWVYRDSLQFPMVLILFPIGVVAIWTLNVFRIVALIAIGAQFSSRVAMGGFHSNAGWISFVVTALGLIWLCHRFSLFAITEKPSSGTQKISESGQAATALLLPFITLLATILVTQALMSDFDWLYPLRVLICAAVLWRYRDYYRSIFVALKLHAVLIGALTFVLWILLVPFSAEDDQAFASSLFSTNNELSSFWIFFRILGAVITVPIIEELLFRGYLINRLTGTGNYHQFGHFTWLSFLCSSLLFGFLHGQWLAGTLAGMAFAGALYVRKQPVDAIVAHMTTNGMPAIYVLSSGHWSLW